MRGFRAALARTVAAAGYRFDAQITVGRPGGRAVTVDLEGDLDGDRRILVVSSPDGGEPVTIEVVGDVATVNRGGTPRPIALTEVPRAPSFELLADLADVEPSGPGTVTGRLPLSAFAEILPETAPSPAASEEVEVTVSFESDGFITSLDMEGPQATFTVSATFRDFRSGSG